MTSERKKEIFLEHYKSLLCNSAIACEKTGVHRQTFYDWCKNDAKFKEKVEEIDESLTDKVESTLLKKIFGYVREFETTKQAINYKKGTVETLVETHKVYIEPSDKLIEFYLKTKGRKRGWNEKIEIENTSKYNINENDIETMKNLSIEEKQQLVRLLDKINA